MILDSGLLFRPPCIDKMRGSLCRQDIAITQHNSGKQNRTECDWNALSVPWQLLFCTREATPDVTSITPLMVATAKGGWAERLNSQSARQWRIHPFGRGTHSPLHPSPNRVEASCAEMVMDWVHLWVGFGWVGQRERLFLSWTYYHWCTISAGCF